MAFLFNGDKIKVSRREWEDLKADVNGLKKLLDAQERALARLSSECAAGLENEARSREAVRRAYEATAEQHGRTIARIESKLASGHG
jgi:hypothetical protein